jgi:hypothetical protein
VPDKLVLELSLAWSKHETTIENEAIFKTIPLAAPHNKSPQ